MPTPSPSLAVAPTVTPPTTEDADGGRIAAGYRFSCAVGTTGGVKCWGDDGDGQLGNGSAGGGAVPVDVQGLGDGVRAVTAGGLHACALSDAGAVSCWGENDRGELGDLSYVDSDVPFDVVGLTGGVRAISAGWAHTCALTASGGVRCWGQNHFGGLGDGTRLDSGVPVEVAGLEDGVVSIAAGGGHTCALTEDGGVWCWGEGQTVDPESAYSLVPIEIPGLASGVTAVSAGMDSTCAVLVGGQITCWGQHYAGRTGDGRPDHPVTIDVSGVSGEVTDIAVGDAHTCVRSDDGAMACWGYNGYGELGHVTLTLAETTAPVVVRGLGSDVRSIAAGGMHTCALMGSGVVTCWGANADGQVGPATTCSSSSAPLVVSFDGTVTEAPTVVVPAGRIGHPTGATDIVLRYDFGPDVGISELGGDQFAPGAEFTLYGDGTVIYRNDGVPPPSAAPPIVRERPFMTTHLDPDQAQALLRYALDDGGLAAACERYDPGDFDTDATLSDIVAIQTDEVVKRILAGGGSPIAPVLGLLRGYEPDASAATEVYVPDRYRAVLLDPANGIESGVLSDPRADDRVGWPWPHLTPDDFGGRDKDGFWWGYPGRVMSTTEAAVLGLSDDGGVVKRVYLIGPDGRTLYSLSLWPMAPEEVG